MKARYLASVAVLASIAAAAAVVKNAEGGSDDGWISVVTSAFDNGSSMAAANESDPPPVAAATVRSSLYPANWLPLYEGGTKDSEGRFLQDFSYAGFRSGDYPIPTSFPGPSVNVVTQYGADNTYDPINNPNSADATNAIQNAVNAVCSAGGGIVNLPAGAYRIKPQGSNTAAITLSCNNIILRGAVDASGASTTYLFNDEANMRGKRVIFAGSVDDRYIWYTSQVTTPTPITVAVTDPTRTITVGSTSGFTVGSPLVVRTDMTAGFKALHSMGPGQNGCDATKGCWWSDDAQGQLYYRVVTAILSGNRIQLDAPIRYILDPSSSTGNNPRAYRTSPAAYNIGIENLKIGMRENNNGGFTDDNLAVPGTGAYETANAQAVRFASAKDSWVKNVRSYKPRANTRNYHIASIGFGLATSTRNISIINSYMGFPQNRLVGGNGYLYVVSGMDNMIQDSDAEAGRHNFMFTNLSSSGNVILRGTSKNGENVSDQHGALSHANLVDGQTIIGRGWQTINRGYLSNGAGVTGTQSVFWNLVKGDTSSYNLVESNQFGYGYIIGSRGNTATVNVTGPSFLAPTDWVEALNNGANLEPQSLYTDQKAKRDANPNY